MGMADILVKSEFDKILYTHCLRWDYYTPFFCKFATELQPLIDVRIWFLRNILNLAKFCIHNIIDNIYVGIVMRHFSQICNRVTALDVRTWILLNIFRMNKQNLTKFCIHINIDNCWDCYMPFCTNLQQS